ncbi:MAG: AMP-binding protein [Candidatus Latescibacterota bacterium]
MPTPITLQELTDLGLDPRAAADLLPRLQACLRLPALQAWQELSRGVLTPHHPFALHQRLHRQVFAAWDAACGPAPAWAPSAEEVEATNLHRLMQDVGCASYPDLHAWSATHRADFWEEMIRRLGIRMVRPYAQVLSLQPGVEPPRWLVDASLNIAESCFAAPPEAVALVHQDEEGHLQRVTYAQLRALTGRVARSLREVGLRPGDGVGVDLPMSVEAVAIYLGIVRAGCVAVAIADTLAPPEIASRLQLAPVRLLFTQDVVGRAGRRLPLFAKVAAAGAPPAVVLAQDGTLAAPLRPGDVTWPAFLVEEEAFETVPRAPEDPINILFSSGTTGTPKAIPWTQTTPIKCAADAYLHHDVRPGDCLAWPTSLGWMMGPWLIFAGLVNRATVALTQAPAGGRAFGRFVQDAGVTMLGVVPSLVRLWRSSGCMEGLDWRAIRVFSSTGECSNPDDMLYLMHLAGYRPVIEYCGGTEIGGGYITGTVVHPAAPATFSTPALGLDLDILDEEGHPANRGEVFVVPPSIGLSTQLLGADHHEVYHAGTPPGPGGRPLRRHGDEMERLGGGYFRAHGRVDDTMNLSGIKVSAVEIERVVARLEGVQEAAAVAVPPPGGGPSELVIYVVLQDGATRTARSLHAAAQRAIREQLSHHFRVGRVVPVAALPRTPSNKVMRRRLRPGGPVVDPPDGPGPAAQER